MSTLADITNAARTAAIAAEQAAAGAADAARAQVAPVRAGLTETQAEVEQHAHAIAETGTDVSQVTERTQSLEEAVDTLILDALMGGL